MKNKREILKSFIFIDFLFFTFFYSNIKLHILKNIKYTKLSKLLNIVKMEASLILLISIYLTKIG